MWVKNACIVSPAWFRPSRSGCDGDLENKEVIPPEIPAGIA
jgi:hypothetical protein